MTESSHYLFCLRHFNDIDNITPAIYFLLERRAVNVTILIYSLNYEYDSDPSLALLKRTFVDRIRIVWIGALAGYSTQLIGRPRLRLWHYRARRLMKQPTLEQAIKEESHSKPLLGWIAPIFSDWGVPRKVIFDQNRSSEIAGLMKVLRDHGVEEIVTLPVSPWVNINVLRQVDFIRTDAEVFWRKHSYEGFDAIGQVDHFYRDSLNDFFSMLGHDSPFQGQEKILGSIRYCTEWLAIRDQHMRSEPPPHAVGKIPLLVIPSHKKNNSFWDEFIRTLHFISQYREYEILVKPHTRYGDGYAVLPENIRLVTEYDTSTLIDWAELILFWGSSAALEGFQKGKIMVCLNYLNGNRSVFSLLESGHQCACRDDLMKVLLSYADSANDVELEPLGADKVIRQVIQGDREGRVPDCYLEYLCES